MGAVMGSGQSQAEQEGGFRIFKVNPGSPAFEAGLEVFFDFITEINGTKMDSDQNTFFANIQEAENKRTKLVVYNIRTHQTRDVLLTPRRWGGSGLLGAVVRYDALDNADSQGIRVLDVFPNSPAQTAGLVPSKDYLLGTTEVMFRDMDELVEIVNLCLGKKMQIYVYNTDSEAIRDVTIVPNTNWGGEGAMGADIRTGLLHRIPPPRRKGVSAATLAHSAVAASQAAAQQHAAAAQMQAVAQQQAGAAQLQAVAQQQAAAAQLHAVAQQQAAAAQLHAVAQQQAAAAQQAAAMQQQQALAEGVAQAPMLATALVHHAGPEAALALSTPARPPELPPAVDAQVGMPVIQAAPPELVAGPPQPAQDAQTLQVQAVQAAGQVHAQAQASAVAAQAPASPAAGATPMLPEPEAAAPATLASQSPVAAVNPQTPTGVTASVINGASAVLANSIGQDVESERTPLAGDMPPPRVPPSTPMAPAEAPSYHMDASLDAHPAASLPLGHPDVKSPGVMHIPPDMPTSMSPMAASAIHVNGETAGAARALHYDMTPTVAPVEHHAAFEGAPNGVPSVSPAVVAAAPAYAAQPQQPFSASQYVLQGAAPGVIYETPPRAPLGAPAPAMALSPAPQVAAQAVPLI